MADIQLTHPTLTRVRQRETVHGTVWQVTYACGCDTRAFRCWHTAMIFATAHRCPAPFEPIPAKRPLVRGGVR